MATLHADGMVYVKGAAEVLLDRCTGALYVTSVDGLLREFLGNRERPVSSGLNAPGELLVLYREGLQCGDGATVLVAESNRVSKIGAKSADESVAIAVIGRF